jgi:hypothetical protein
MQAGGNDAGWHLGPDCRKRHCRLLYSLRYFVCFQERLKAPGEAQGPRERLKAPGEAQGHREPMNGGGYRSTPSCSEWSSSSLRPQI